MKKYNLGTIKVEMKDNGFPNGLILNRELTLRECRYILRNLLGIEIGTLEDFYDREEYSDYNDGLKKDVNEWMVGNLDDSAIMEYAYDCSDECLGIMNLIPIISYLKKHKVID